MIIILKKEFEPGMPELEQLEKVASRFPELKLSAHNVKGSLETISEVYVLGPTRQVPLKIFEELPFVNKVVRVNFDITGCSNVKVEPSVTRESIEHVCHEGEWGFDIVFPGFIKVYCEVYFCFFCVS